MPRTKHVFIIVLVIVAILLCFLIYKSFGAVRETAQIVPTQNPFAVSESVFTLAHNPETDKKTIREGFLAKLEQGKHTASLIQAQSAEPATPTHTEEETKKPTKQTFDWSVWESRVTEFDDKKTQYDADVANIHASLAIAESGKSTLTDSILASATETPATLIAKSGVACFDAEIGRDNTTLENSDVASLGLLYKVITDEIRLKMHEAQVTTLAEQIQLAEPKYGEVMSAYTRDHIDCSHFLTEFEGAS